MKILNKLLPVIGAVIVSFFYAFSCDEITEDIEWHNNSKYGIYAVISTEYPNAYLPSKKYDYIELWSEDGLKLLYTETSREDYFKQCRVLQIICYHKKKIESPSPELIDFMRNNHCELVIYEYTQKELEAMDWTVVINDEDIEEYQATHETIPIPDYL